VVPGLFVICPSSFGYHDKNIGFGDNPSMRYQETRELLVGWAGIDPGSRAPEHLRRRAVKRRERGLTRRQVAAQAGLSVPTAMQENEMSNRG
jgi:hypothetical protein